MDDNEDTNANESNFKDQTRPRSWREKDAPEASRATTATTTATNTLGQTWDSPRPGFAHRGPRNRNNTTVEPTKGGIKIERKGENAFYNRPRRTKQEIGELTKKRILGKIRKTTAKQVETRQRRQDEAKKRKEEERNNNPLTWNIRKGEARYRKGCVKIATFNCMGINETEKRNKLDKWALKKHIKIIAVQQIKNGSRINNLLKSSLSQQELNPPKSGRHRCDRQRETRRNKEDI